MGSKNRFQRVLDLFHPLQLLQTPVFDNVSLRISVIDKSYAVASTLDQNKRFCHRFLTWELNYDKNTTYPHEAPETSGSSRTRML